MNGIVYKFDENTGEYLGEYQSQKSPLEPGKWLDDIPNTLKVAPPPTAKNEVACAVDGAWVVKPDFRGTWYKPDGSTVEITELDVLPAQDWSLTEPPLSVAKVWDLIKSERDTRKAAGVKVVVNGEDKWFHSDDPSRIQQLGLVMMGANIPSGLQWKTMDGTFVTMTQAVAGQIFQSVATHDVTVFGVAEAHRLAMEASQTPADYDYSTGWPQTFEE